MEPAAPYTNQQAPPKPLPIQGLLVITIVVLIAIIGFKSAWALNIRNKTGILEVSSPTDTSLSISAQNSGASSIGLGTTRVRLAPGTYLILGVKNGEHGTAVVTVTKGQVTRASVEPRGN